MKIRTLILLGIAVFGFACHQKNASDYSIEPGELWPDNNGVHVNAHGGGMLFQDGTYYWYGEHKTEGKIGNTAQVGVRCYSSSDLYNWKDEGVVLKVEEADTLSDIARGCIIERPKVIYNSNTKKYVMWFHLELRNRVGYNSARSGVAVSDQATGPYTYLKSVRPNAGYWPINVLESQKEPVGDWVKDSYFGGSGNNNVIPAEDNVLGRDFEGGQMARDMNLFVDDDGTAYHIYSSEENSTLHISKLSDDYLSCTGRYIRVFPYRYHEGAAMFKRKGKYYLITSDCSGWAPNEARSAVADDIFGEWKELGNPCIGQDSALTFYSQSTFVLPVQGKEDAFIFMGDRWAPENPIDGRYIWLPVKFDGDRPILEWKDAWDLTVFND